MEERKSFSLGGIQDHSFEDELVNGLFPSWRFSGSANVIREEFREFDGGAAAPFLSRLYFDPFQMLEKEVLWWNKT